MVISFQCVDLRAILYPIHFGVNECIWNVKIVSLVYSEFDEIVGEYGMLLLVWTAMNCLVSWFHFWVDYAWGQA